MNIQGTGGEYTNHACTPNVAVHIDTWRPALHYVAIRDIEKEEEISFNYNTTEWEIMEPFTCTCENCGGTLITGAKTTSSSTLRVLLPYCSHTILHLLCKKTLNSN